MAISVPLDIPSTDPTVEALACVRDHACAVDAEARFPVEGIAALRGAGWLQPPEGQEDEALSTLVSRCRAVGEACSSTGLIFAMHHIMLACLQRHGGEALQQVPEALTGQWLLASSTTEQATGGDISRSLCAVRDDGNGNGFLEKDASVLSYAEQSDLILVTARRDAQAEESDQVLVAIPTRDVRLRRVRDWSGLGMRGTESHGYRLLGRFPRACVMDVPYTEILRQTMQPYSHLCWSAVWYGIARRAVCKATTALRRSGGLSSAGPALAAINHRMDRWWAMQAQAMALLTGPLDDGLVARTRRTSVFNGLKVEASETARQVVMDCLDLAGFPAYGDTGSCALGPEIRDILSAPLMVSNSRLRTAMAASAALSMREQAV
ncbi:acyl-CoA dehydrogenase family protein [Roseobacter sp.]|uniref:acyl-CoA dehydrogenase family protein n=1 Tax=Roseobacter sp. TaxID=1907202 RepID=UPI0026285F58|nr:acyl-CoA dehydrogenase family protein [Roseobacter sp.]MDW3180794.1 acyl-CoA dehydrogenase family protein [Roseobacter sp.]